MFGNANDWVEDYDMSWNDFALRRTSFFWSSYATFWEIKMKTILIKWYAWKRLNIAAIF